jgi:hypothetical protein
MAPHAKCLESKSLLGPVAAGTALSDRFPHAVQASYYHADSWRIEQV